MNNSESVVPQKQKKGDDNSQSPSRHPSRPVTRSRDGTAGRFGIIWKFFGLLFLPAIFGYMGMQMYERFVVLPARIISKTDLPSMLAVDSYNRPELYWGSYRSNLYFGMRTRSPRSPVIGLMWYEQPQRNVMIPLIRHWCNQDDHLGKYGWLEHDGRTFGVQELEDDRIVVRTIFVKRPGGDHGGDWTARISALPSTRVVNNPSNVTSLHSFIVYIALNGMDTSDDSYLQPNLFGDHPMTSIDRIRGFTPELGHFVLRFTEPSNVIARAFLAVRIDPFPDGRQFKELIIGSTGIVDIQSKHFNHYLGLMGYFPKNAPPTEQPNFLAIQITFVKSTSFEVVFESTSFSNRPNELIGPEFDSLLTERRAAFKLKFEQTFGLASKSYPDFYQIMGQSALANMLGSIGYFYGSNKVQGSHNSEPVLYGPHSLFSTVPSRPFFPHGFLWDEGFHHLLLHRFDPDLSMEMLGSWLDLMNVEGWIPREMILGAEGEHRVPSQFIVQRDSVANPPMFFYLISRLVEEGQLDNLRKVYPRLKLWYRWLNESQSGSEVGTYRWRGRNATTEFELNAKTMASGLDDYPRASHPSDEEYHLDLLCWMAVSSRVMEKLAGRMGDPDKSLFTSTSQLLSDPEHLISKHWSDKSGRFCDFGRHTRHVRLIRPLPPTNTPGRPSKSPNVMLREVLREAQTRLVSDTFGYVSLYPMFLRLLPFDSPQLTRILDQLADSDLLWTPFGLRSLARTSPLYHQRNTEHDPPYWRGSIWLNMNYLALSSLRYYATQSGPQQNIAFKLYSDLRTAVVSNVAKEYKRTGFLWEHYNDESGHGEGAHPFTGWTSLVLLMMSEQYD